MSFENVEVTISTRWGDNTLPFNDWLNSDVDVAFQRTPKRITYKETGEELPYSYIPMPYRQNFVSHFYVDSGICEPPWQTNKSKVLLKNTQQTLLDSREKNKTQYIVRFEDYVIGFPFKVVIFQDEIGIYVDRMYLTDVFTKMPQQEPVNLAGLITLCTTLVYLNKFSTPELKSEISVESQNKEYWMNHLEVLLPDPNLGIELERQYNNADSGFKCYAIHKLEEHNLTVLTAMIKLPDIEYPMQIETKTWDMIQRTKIPFIALTKKSNGVDYLRSIIRGLELYPK